MADILIERYANRVRVTVCPARPGIVIGRGGQRVDELRKAVESAARGKRVRLKYLRGKPVGLIFGSYT